MPPINPPLPPPLPITLLPPSPYRLHPPSTDPPPSLPGLSPTTLATRWTLTHSSLPFWKDKRNVHTTYAVLPPNPKYPHAPPQMDTISSYQDAHSDKVEIIHGTDTENVAESAAGVRSRKWRWRGNGWLRVARSKWEILSFGSVAGSRVDDGETVWGGNDGGGGEQQQQQQQQRMGGGMYMVIYAQKSLFFPTGVWIATTREGGLTAGVLEGIVQALGESVERVCEGQRDEWRKIVEGLYEIEHD